MATEDAERAFVVGHFRPIKDLIKLNLFKRAESGRKIGRTYGATLTCALAEAAAYWQQRVGMTVSYRWGGLRPLRRVSSPEPNTDAQSDCSTVDRLENFVRAYSASKKPGAHAGLRCPAAFSVHGVNDEVATTDQNRNTNKQGNNEHRHVQSPIAVALVK
jgi:hypothetical protein